MSDAEYQLWRGGIAYAERLLDDQNYDEFSESHLMFPFPIEVCASSFPSLLPLCLVRHACGNIGMCDKCLRLKLVQLPVALLILLTYLGRSMPMVWTGLLESVLWCVTLTSWVIPSLRGHEL